MTLEVQYCVANIEGYTVKERVVAHQAELNVRGAGGVEAMQRFSRTENNVCGCMSTTLGFRLAQCRSGRDAGSRNRRLMYRVANSEGFRGGFAKALIGGHARPLPNGSEPRMRPPSSEILRETLHIEACTTTAPIVTDEARIP